MKTKTYTIENWKSNVIDIVSRKFEVCTAEGLKYLNAWADSTGENWTSYFSQGLDHYDAGHLIASKVWLFKLPESIESFFTLVEVRADGYGFVVMKPREKCRIEKVLPLWGKPQKGYEHQIVSVLEARENSKLTGREYLY